MKKRSSLFKKNFIFLFFLLLIFWHIVNAGISVESLLVGTVAVIAITYLNRDIIFTERDGGPITIRFIWDFIVLIALLIVEVIKSNIEVAKVVLKPKMSINPSFVTTPVKPKKDFNKVLYGNVITLTPGTLTVDITDDGYLVHALNDEFGEGMEGSVSEKQVLKLEVKE